MDQLTIDPPSATRSALRVAFLASGSRGNATAVCCGGETLLIDAGVSARETCRRLAACGIAERSVCAVLLTHEHADHVAGVRVLARRLGVPVLGTEGTLRGAASALADVPEVGKVTVAEELSLGAWQVRAFATSHDAAQPVGYVLRCGESAAFGLASDTGMLSAGVLEALRGCALVGLEANHDVEMLRHGPYPRFLKERIASARGHLSNDDAAGALETLLAHGTRTVCALHLSEHNNTATVARRTLEARLAELDGSMRVAVARQDAPVVCEL